MPKKTAALVPLSDLYRRAFNSCVAVWPILIIRVVYLFLCLIFLLSGAFICFMPFLKNIFDHLRDLNEGNFQNLISEIDWTSYFGDFHNLITAALLTAIGITLGGFFWAFFGAAVYSELNRNQKTGQAFSLKSFFEGGIRKMIPMVGLQFAWFFIFLGVIFVFGFAGVLGVFIAKATSWWIVILLAIPMGLIFALALALLVTGAILSAAYLVDGYGIRDSVKEGVLKAVQHKGRAMWASLLIILVYMIFFTSFSAVFDVLSKFPIVGIIFAIFEFLVTSILAIGYDVFMSSLSVALQLEPKASR
jgi:hypothetical protein